MAWETLTAPNKNNNAKPVPVRVGMRKIPTGSTRMNVVVEATILDELGGDADRYSVELGTGQNSHQLRIVASNAGAFDPSFTGKNEKFLRFILPSIDRLPREQVQSVECSYVVDKAAHALIIDLPSWAWMKKAA